MLNDSQFFERAKSLTPGGVHSPVRSFKGLGRDPLFVQKGQGAYFYDTSGRNYIDFCMSFGPLIFGHADLDVCKALERQMQKGWSYGSCEPYSLELAEFLVPKLPGVEQIRFVNSGTEAVMTALRLARGYTKRSKIIKFNGCYHGHADSMLIKAGSGLAGTATASSAGIPPGIADDTFVLELESSEKLQECFERYPQEIAAVIIEPLPANNGLLVQETSFLQDIRKITRQYNALLIFDEVISGFRLGFSGMIGETGIIPDLVTYGKIIGGGLPVGAIAGPQKLMECLAPIGEVYQAGTLSANPLAMVGGLSTLKKLTPQVYASLEEYSSRIHSVFCEWLENYDSGRFRNFHMVRKGSLFWIHPQQHLSIDLTSTFASLYNLLLQKGIYLSPNAYEIGFISLAHDDGVLEELKTRLWS